ncbi:MAG: sugar ABC transporter ATP-binding protein [Rhodobacteraceae bacterium]|jgi:ABC-type sugar transport system ATPase subunit|nr:sugar ABC transporter ATP-binding protein [Paracoccaceae bacterium]
MIPLRVTDVSKSYGGVRALRPVSFDVRAGEVHALLGENGAGKSTLIRILSGLVTPDTGVIDVDGAPRPFRSPRDAQRAGIVTIHQELLLFPDLSIAENICMADAPGALGRIDRAAQRAKARALLAELDSGDLDPAQPVRSLSVAERQRVEIARALGRQARVLIMDEPTASLADADVARLIAIVQRLRDRGVGIVYVSHKLSEVRRLADRVTVLRDGGFVATRDAAGITEADMIGLMVGRDIAELYPKGEPRIGDEVLRVEGLTLAPRVRDVSFTLRAGEILGLAGLVGAGRTELARLVFGLDRPTAGRIVLDGREIRVTSPQAAVAQGIAYVPEDRGLQGLVRSMPVAANVTMASLAQVVRGLFLSRRAEAGAGTQAIAQLGIRAPRGPEHVAGKLSGGNQQKVVVAKWLRSMPRVLILDEPTRGVDVGAKSEIHALMGDLTRQGLAILMISSELPEVLGMSDRVMVMSRGRITATLDRAEATPERVGAAMVAEMEGAT